jgi:hypothetical protein
MPIVTWPVRRSRRTGGQMLVDPDAFRDLTSVSEAGWIKIKEEDRHASAACARVRVGLARHATFGGDLHAAGLEVRPVEDQRVPHVGDVVDATVPVRSSTFQRHPFAPTVLHKQKPH